MRTRWLGLAVLSLGVSMIIVDATIVNVALPSIIREFEIGLADAEWINSIYSLVFAALLITLGKVGDLTGRRRMFLVGLAVFVAASMMAGRAESSGALIAARLLQGVGAAVILPSTLSTVNATFRGRERGIAFGIWGSVIGGMAALGPLLGGWLTSNHSWRWAFYINLPIGLLAAVGTILWVAETRETTHRPGFDTVGTLLSGAGMTGIVFALIEGPRFGFITPTEAFRVGDWQWPSSAVSPSLVSFILGVGLLAWFARTQAVRARAGKPVLFDLELFDLRSFSIGNMTASILSLGEFGLVFVLPLFLQAVLGYSAFQTGLLLMALAIGAFIGGPSAAALATKIGPRRVVSWGMALEAIAITWVAFTLAPDQRGWAFVPGLVVYGVGVGLASAQLTSVILAEVPPAESGQASGMQSTFRQVGAAVGIALLGSVLSASLQTQTAAALESVPGLPDVARQGITEAIAGSAGQALPSIAEQPGSEAVVAAVSDAFATAARLTGLVAVVFVVVGFLLSLRLPDIRYADAESADS
ncbi:MAG: DHA2 family efflux MFS transporter permease subunit [Acidimicrobiia bacterium]|nr:DHA2 family efflux MFS transporter permease subunit [Acidimicrobiia bacterium]